MTAITKQQRTIEESLDSFDLFDSEIKLTKPLSEIELSDRTLNEINSSIRRDSQKLLIPEVINEQILTVAEEERVGRTLCQHVALTTGDSMTWLKERGFEATQIAEGAEIPSRKGTYEKFTLTVGKTGIRPHITNEMVEDSRWDVIRRNLDMATKAMARLEDLTIMNAMTSGVPNGSAISSGAGGIGEVIGNHYIQMGDTPTEGTLAWKSIALGHALLRMEHYRPDTLLIHPYQMVDIMTGEGDFIGANERAYLTLPDSVRSSMQNGTIGNIGGMRVVVSANITAGTALMFDSSVYCIFLERRPLAIDEYNDILNDMRGIVMTQRYTASPVTRDAAVLLYGGKTDLFP